MVDFDKEMARFNYRVAGVAIHNGRVLLDRNTKNHYWVLPGGHPEIMEPMTDAVRREVREEIGAEVEVVRLLWIVENFYHRNKDIHELSFYFLINLHPGSPLLRGDGPFYGQEHDHPLIYQWHPIDESLLFDLPIMPSFLATSLTDLPKTPQHIVFNDIKKAQGAKVDNFLTIR